MSNVVYRYFVMVLLLVQAGLQPLVKSIPWALPSDKQAISIGAGSADFRLSDRSDPARRHRQTPTRTPLQASPTLPSPTATRTGTSLPPSPTSLPSTATRTGTSLPPPPTLPPPTATRTGTSLPPSPTLPPPTATRTGTSLPPSPTSLPPTATQTDTFVPTATIPATATATPTQKPSPVPAPAGVRAMRVDYKNYATSRAEVATWEQNMQAAGINLVVLGAGRVEWTYFKWAGHEQYWSNDVKDSGIDFLAQDAARFGQWAQINAVIDVLSPNYILAHPGSAAINASGRASTDLVSTNELVNGNYGRLLLDMVGYIAANYPVDSISITELSYHIDGYGPDDLALFTAATGRSDWPRNSDGSIDINDPSIGTWRSAVLGDYLGKAAALAHAHGKQLYFDVGVDINNLGDAENNHGTNYGVMLQHTDKLVVWGYFGDYGYSPSKTKQLAQYLTQYGLDHIILSIGLWGPSGSAVSAADFKTAIQASLDGGMPDLWICPGSLMTASHWQVLDDLWGTH
jgi:hypothetical protein